MEMGHLKATCPKLNRQCPFELKANEPSNYVCDVHGGKDSNVVDKVQKGPGETQLVYRPVDQYKEVLNAKVTEPVDTGLTEKEGKTSTIVNAEQPFTRGECIELHRSSAGSLNKTSHKLVMYRVACFIVCHFGSKC